ncbi:MAG: 4-(cytidine 5'-diphospho)-2-C-methyl-D-erythritol kinase [Bdellovibrionales bacterium]|nr:4-(cytidine 5'-diphospho)-2-C-methyl-D-erythritol kinase [Bdellovibrionales bacterium]
MAQTSIEILAPAKLNLRLRVEDRRTDGYHLLKMLNCCVSIFDNLKLSLAERSSLSLTGPSSEGIGAGSDNLCIKALNEFSSHFGFHVGVKIDLDKQIPHGTGLAGGSSDAAAVLRGLRILYKHELVGVDKLDEELVKIATRIGADVPYHMSGGLALIEGIGEIVSPISAPAEFAKQEVFVAFPSIKLSTVAVYDQFRCSNFILKPDLAFPVLSRDMDYSVFWEAICRSTENDLEEAILRLAPSLLEIIGQLREERELTVQFTGSGSAFYLLPNKGKLSPNTLVKVEKFLAQSQVRLIRALFLPNPGYRVE